MRQAALRTVVSALAITFLVSCRSPGPVRKGRGLAQRWHDSGLRRRWHDAALERRLKAVSTYQHGSDRRPAAALSDFLTEHDDAEERARFGPRLAAVALDPSVTRAGRQHVIRELGRVGSVASAPDLAVLLEDDVLADDAAMALQRIPAPEVNGILHTTLATAVPTARPRIITILGQRGNYETAGIISPLLRDSNDDVAQATAEALGKLATEEAAAALVKAMPNLRNEVRTAAWDALLACHAAAFARKDSRTVRRITVLMENAKAPPPIRAGTALAAWQTASADGAAREAGKMMASADAALRSAGAALARNRADRPSLANLVALLPKLPPDSQVALMGLFEDAGVTEAAAVIADLASTTNATIQRAALRALRSTGTAGSVKLLAEAAASGPEKNRATARASLRLLSGSGVDQEIIDLSRDSPVAVRVELIRAMGDRGMVAALPTLFIDTADANALIREAAMPQIGELARSREWPSLLDLFSDENSEKERQLLITAAAVAGKRVPDSGPALATRLGAVPSKSSRIALITVAGRLSDDTTLNELVRAACHADIDVRHAALRALGNWRSLSGYLPLKVAAEDSDDQSRRIAQRGAVQVIRQSEGLDEDTRIDRYVEIGKCIENAEELRLLLSAVGELKGMGAFEVAAMFLNHPEVGPEAEAAAVRIAKQLPKKGRGVKKVLKRIAAESGSRPMRNEADALLGRKPEPAPEEEPEAVVQEREPEPAQDEPEPESPVPESETIPDLEGEG